MLVAQHDDDDDIGMKFGNEKCVISTMTKGKNETTEEIELTNKECIRKKNKIPSTREYWKWTPSNRNERKKIRDPQTKKKTSGKQACREEENLVFWFGAQFISTLNFTQSICISLSARTFISG